ncbi:MAG: TVP38/TMEM64 family protein [Phycisphaerales bacterium]|jgi:uncharacterized membrane protein YdjX (TVP38/TMEM64 family)
MPDDPTQADPRHAQTRGSSGGDSATAIAKELGPTGVLAAVASFMPAIAGIFLLANIGDAAEWLKSHGQPGIAVYIGCFALLSGLALLPTYAQAVLGGYAFGMMLGVPAALAGFVGGAVIAYEIGARTSGERVERLISRKPKWKAVRDALVGSKDEGDLLKSIGTVSLLRLPPNSPFALMNLLLSAVKVPRLAYLVGTCIGMAPRTAAAVAIGAGIKEALTRESIDRAMPRWMIIAGIAVTVGIALIIGSIANRAIRRVSERAGG